MKSPFTVLFDVRRLLSENNLPPLNLGYADVRPEAEGEGGGGVLQMG